MEAKRNLSIDLLRGYLLVVIIVDHLGRFPGGFDIVTGQGRLWVSAAEGFFIVCGLLVGIIRRSAVQQGQLGLVWRKLWRRAGELYLWSAGLTFGFTSIGQSLATAPGLKAGLSLDNWPTIIWQTLTLRYTYGWADFLPHYVVFMLAAPFMLYLLYKGRTWWLICLSVLLWIFRGQSFEMAWQILFVVGLVVGYHLPALSEWTHRQSFKSKQLVRRLLYRFALATLLINVSLEFGPFKTTWLHERYLWIGQYFDKWSLAPGRLVLSLVWFGALYLFIRQHEATLDRWLGQVLVPLGRNSLLVYAVHSGLAFTQPLVWPRQLNPVANFAIDLMVILAVWTSAKWRDNARQASREVAVGGLSVFSAKLS
ncbi:MAG TPA: OpgC domain-containing protein [Candidatus Nanoarchaeia archaeon]|nr:OpgC domain-containing protein [Candidatus Nanoarchaeia archaeon]